MSNSTEFHSSRNYFLKNPYFSILLLDLSRLSFLIVSYILVFSVLKSRLWKFEAKGYQFVTFLRNFPYSRELKKQIINVPVVLIYLLQLYFPEKSLDSLQEFPRDLCCILMPYLSIWFINLSKYGMSPTKLLQHS